MAILRFRGAAFVSSFLIRLSRTSNASSYRSRDSNNIALYFKILILPGNSQANILIQSSANSISPQSRPENRTQISLIRDPEQIQYNSPEMKTCSRTKRRSFPPNLFNLSANTSFHNCTTSSLFLSLSSLHFRSKSRASKNRVKNL